MAGAKGAWGGKRPNTGGARPGAGRKPKADPVGKSVDPVLIEGMDMLQMLQAVALGKIAATTIQVRAAIAAIQYTHTKRGDGGKKEEAAEKAKKAGAGRFGPRSPPLSVVNHFK